MKLRICSRQEAEAAKARENWAVVSITDPGTEPANLKLGWGYVLRLQFSDIDSTKRGVISPFLWAEIEKVHPPMTAKEAAEVVAFVGAMEALGVEGILCHCEAGVSRSAAVAKWIADAYHLPPLGPAVAAHNRWVYQLLTEAAMEARDDHQATH